MATTDPNDPLQTQTQQTQTQQAPKPAIPAYKDKPETDVRPSASVADNMNTLLDKSSPYLKQAESYAREAANKRGLINSSMAVGAAEQARIGAALPIAQQDAQGVMQERLQSQQGDIQSRLQGEQFEHQLSLSEKEHAQRLGLSEAQYQQQLGLGQQQFGFQKQLTQLNDAVQRGQMTLADSLQRKTQIAVDSNRYTQERMLQQLRGDQALVQAERVARIEADYKTLMQSSASAAEFMLNINNEISDILQSSLSSTAKNTAVTKMLDMMESGMEVIGQVGGLDLNSLLNYGGATPAPR